MRNVSSAFKQALANDDRRYFEYADFTLEDNTVLNLTNEHFWQGGFSWEDAVASSNFEIGSAIINKVTLVLNNIYEDFDEYDFFGATAILKIGLEINGVIEKVTIGKYTVVNQPKYNGSLITIELYDNMYKFDKPYSESTLIYPASLDTIVRNACTNCGVTLITTNFPNKNFVVLNRPDDERLTYREVIAYAAQISGCYARCNENGYLAFGWFDFDSLETAKTTDNVSGVHYIDDLYSKQFSVDEVVITGVKVSVDYDREVQETQSSNTYTRTEFATEEYLSGTDGYVITIKNNQLIDHTQVQTVATYLGNRINGVSFRTADVTHGSDPSIEAGDVAVYIDNKNRRYGALISKTVFSSNSAQKSSSIAEEPIRNTSARYSADTKNYVKARQMLAQEKTERERVEDDLAERISQAGGLYETQVQQTGGGVITYLHNKTLLAESDIQIMVSDVGVLVTANGTAQSPTWYGLTVDGQLIANILNTVGVNADWINTGQLVITKNGSEVFFADVDTGTVRIKGDTISITSGDPISTAIDSAEQSAYNYTDQQVATAGGYTLETPFTWSNNNQTANFTAIVYKGTEDVTSTFDANWFVWTLRTEDGETQVGTGKTLTLSRSQFGYGATITCTLSIYDNVVSLRSVDNKKLKSVDDRQLLMYDNQDGDVLVSDLPLKTAAEVDPTDKLMGIDNVEGYQVSITNFGDFLATSKYDARYVNANGDTMTGSLRMNGTDLVDTRPSANYYSPSFSTCDANGVGMGYYNHAHYTDGMIAIQLGAQRNVNGTMKYNTLYLRLDESGNASVAFSGTGITASWRNAIGAVNKAGDTMTGNLTINYSGLSQIKLRTMSYDSAVGSSVPSSGETAFAGMQFSDSQDYNNGWVRVYKNSSDKVYLYNCVRRGVNGSAIINYLQLGINADGTRYVAVNDAAAWRNAIMPVGSIASLASNTVYYRKIGDKVCVWGQGVSCGTSWTDIATLPSGYRPRDRNMYFAGICGSNGNRHMSVGILTSGIIRASSSTAATDGYFYVEFFAS